MSERIEDLVKLYENTVYHETHSRSIGLFPIPEYPEYEVDGGMWSTALDVILTTLRYLAPATLLTLFWGQQSFLFKILKHIDSAFRSIVFSSEEQKQSVLQWLAEVGAVRVESLDTVWRHGWILCGVLDAAMPGACAGHPPTRLSLKHAQAIADHYLGVEPVFTRQELESNDSLSRHQEWKLATYIDRIRLALSKLTPPVSKPVSQRTSPEMTQFTLDYVAKGSGLAAAQLHNKAHFKIYPTGQQSLDPGEITILIRGPKDTYGMAVLPPIFGKAQMIRHKLLGLQSKHNYTENILPITQGATYMRTYGKNDMNKTYYIPKAKYDIEIEMDIRSDHAKINYVVNIEGKYLVSITSRGQNIAGSPFTVTGSHNIISVLEKDSYCLEDGEEIDIVDVKNDRKVVLRIVDFVTEKMLLKENGTLERISEDEAKLLMTNNGNKELSHVNKIASTKKAEKYNYTKKATKKTFYKAAMKIRTMQRVCKLFHDLRIETQLRSALKEQYENPRNHKVIPDIVNSTFTESNVKSYIIPETREKVIVPENISVSLKSEKSYILNEEWKELDIGKENILIGDTIADLVSDSDQSNASNNHEDYFNMDKIKTSNATNPFLNDILDENFGEKKFGTYVTSEYETNNSQSEETTDSPIKIVIEQNMTSSPSNPFIEVSTADDIKDITDMKNIAELERPKTPVYKIIAGEKLNRDEPVYIDPKMDITSDESLGNEFINPFFMHHHSSHYNQPPVTDFIIGAPVSLPPLLRSISPEPRKKSLVENNEDLEDNMQGGQNQENLGTYSNETAFSTPLHDYLDTRKSKREYNSTVSSTFHSLESNATENIDITSSSDDRSEICHIDSRDSSPRKDIWDSAYVSIDDNNSSPDSNNNESTHLYDTHSKHKFSPTNDKFEISQEEVINMGPAEREIWQTCSELGDIAKLLDEAKLHKWERKRTTFTPIIEESDRSLSSGVTKSDIYPKHEQTDSISVAFAELNDIYQEYFPNSEYSSTSSTDEDDNHCLNVECKSQREDTRVDSASEIADVKRHDEELEGTISEVQSNVTESVSVSQILHEDSDNSCKTNYDKGAKPFSKINESKIVLEKKKYWDERIRQIEAKTAETPVLQKKKRTPSKQLKHDSLSKRRGKQMIKNFLNSGDYNQVVNINQGEDKTIKDQQARQSILENPDTFDSAPKATAEHLVEKWKKYWDEKLEAELALQCESPSYGKKSPLSEIPVRQKSQTPPATKTQITKSEHRIQNNLAVHEADKLTNKQPIRHELPEEVFKAFETSPKRFFGTSRKHILNKIDTFLGKPTTTETLTPGNPGSCHETGLVSSRISLFHNLTNTEPLPWARKTQSLHNLTPRTDRNATSTNDDRHNLKQSANSYAAIPEKIETRPFEATNEILSETVNLKNKRARMLQTQYNKTFDDTMHETRNRLTPHKVESEIINTKTKERKVTESNIERLRKKSFSRSEMDLFNKALNHTTDDYLDKYKSFDELPKLNVKNVISLYESVSNTNVSIPSKRMYRNRSEDSQRPFASNSIESDAVHKRLKYNLDQESVSHSESIVTIPDTSANLWKSYDTKTSNLSLSSEPIDIEVVPDEKTNTRTTYVTLSDIDLEIVESCPSSSKESTPEAPEPAHIEYKNRFKLAKQFFQSLEELREDKKPRKFNECELLLRKSEEPAMLERPQKRVRNNVKSHSMPSSEISKIWNQLQESQGNSSETKLVKISEKFNVEDLFSDVTEGKLSRQGSLRGIPHKKAVLETFRSMENISDAKLSSYDTSESQLSDFTKEYKMINAQSYLKEYPYLPTTDPSKYHSRIDAKASGLITLSELKERKPRRNSVPELRLNPKFTEQL